MCDRGDLILNPLFNFEPVNGLEHVEYWGDVKFFGSAGNGTCKSVLNMLKALHLSDGYTVVKGVTVIEA